MLVPGVLLLGKNQYVVTPPRGSILLEVSLPMAFWVSLRGLNACLVDRTSYPTCVDTCLVDEPSANDQEY